MTIKSRAAVAFGPNQPLQVVEVDVALEVVIEQRRLALADVHVGDQRTEHAGDHLLAAERGVRVRMVLQDLGPSFIKLGQIASTRADVVPDDILKELRRLQDDVPPIPYEDVKKVVESSFGRPIEEIYETFQKEPLATASIGPAAVSTVSVPTTVNWYESTSPGPATSIEIVAPSPFSVVAFRWTSPELTPRDTDAANARILARINSEGRSFISHALVGGRYTLRVAIGNIRTERRHLQTFLQVFRDAVAEESPRKP